MKKLATLHKFESAWVALPALDCDILFGKASPNQQYIMKNGLPIEDGADLSQAKENQIVYGEHILPKGYDNRGSFEILDLDGKKYMDND